MLCHVEIRYNNELDNFVTSIFVFLDLKLKIKLPIFVERNFIIKLLVKENITKFQPMICGHTPECDQLYVF